MGRKRKSGAPPLGRLFGKGDHVVGTSQFAADATFANSEDEFESGRDRIFLDETPEAKRRRKLEEDEQPFQPSDEEIFGLESASDDNDDLADMEEDEEYEEGGAELPLFQTLNSRRHGVSSLGLLDRAEAEGGDDNGILGWGSSKKDYYDADVIETEADALEEEKETRRIQQKRLQLMTEADFGFDEAQWVSGQWDERAQENGEVKGAVTEVLPKLQITDDMSTDVQLEILKQWYPEFEPLSKDFVTLQTVHGDLAVAAKAAEADSTTSKASPAVKHAPPVAVVKFRTLSAYLGAISMYFLLLSSPAMEEGEGSLAMSAAKLREHPIMDTLVKTRKMWEQVRNLSDTDFADTEGKSDSKTSKKQRIGFASKDSGVEGAEYPTESTVVIKNKTESQKAAEEVHVEAEDRRAQRIRQTEDGLAELSKFLEPRISQKPKLQKRLAEPKEDDSDFGEETVISTHEVAEKVNKKRSLRFYTSQIAQKANRRGIAGRDAGGDADLPYRERLKDRQARLNIEAEKRGRQQAADHERLSGENAENDYQGVGEAKDDTKETDSDDYYDMVAAHSKQKKANKEKLAIAHFEPAHEGRRAEVQEELAKDGKRAITYAIEKNKGLTPKRNKDVRNPRVKKRKKYEQKKKKLGSIRQVYKGGEGPGGYGGELTGIKKNLVRSVKL